MCGPRYALSPSADAERVLQQRAAGQHRRVERRRHADRLAARSRASGAAPTGAPAMTRATESSQRVSMSRSCSRNKSAIAARRASASSLRYASGSSRQVARRHHQRPRRRRAAAGDAAACTAASARPAGCSGATVRRQRRLPARGARQHDRPLDRRQQRSLLVGRESAIRSACAQVLRPSRQTASRRGACAARSRRTAVVDGRVAGQVKAAEPLDRDDRAAGRAPSRRPRSDRRTSTTRPSRRHQRAAAGRTPDRRSAARGSADRAGSSYSRWHAAHIVNAAIVVAGAVVRHVARDREARAAVRAVGERIAIAAIRPDRRSRRGTSGQVARSGGIETRRSVGVLAVSDRERVERFGRNRASANARAMSAAGGGASIQIGA